MGSEMYTLSHTTSSTACETDPLILAHRIMEEDAQHPAINSK